MYPFHSITYHTMLNSVRRFSSHVCKEVTFPVPWGVIAGKQWTSVDADCRRGAYK